MRALTLRRTGFAAALVTGLLLTGSAVHGMSGVDAELELAAYAPERPVLTSYHERGRDGCDQPRRDERPLT